MPETIFILCDETYGTLVDQIYSNHKAARDAQRQLNKKRKQNYIIKQVIVKDEYDVDNTKKRD
jgi:hypothetical protein